MNTIKGRGWMQEDNIVSTLVAKDKQLSSMFKVRFGTAIVISVVCLLIVNFFMMREVSLGQYPYDIDGWGHLVPVDQANTSGKEEACNFSLNDAYNPERGFLLPAIFGTAYCLTGSVEAVQWMNLALHVLSCFIIVLCFSKQFKSLIIPSVAVLLWSIWPAYSYLHGYYFSEQIGAFFIVLAVCLLISIGKEVSGRALWLMLGIGLSLAVLLHVRASSLLFVLGIFGLVAWWYKRHLGKVLASFAAFVLIYVSLPIVNYQHFSAFIPFTTQGGFALHEGTYLPGDDLPAAALRKIPEFNEREAKTVDMNAYERDKYWKSLAIQNIADDPIGQIELLFKKAMRFWAYVPGYSWVPTTKSLVFALPLFVVWLLSLTLLKNRNILIINMAVVSTWAMHTLIHSEYRYSYVVFPLIVVSCGIWVLRFIETTLLKKQVRD
ncbi:hypothetical protein [Agaribacter flavus]|uniref:Glycosyltransferase RgtA/B/C/D-like domain-containing protein n=1 Tax=Agaribacter flavus TaxID=1902781 RepID=A0ABV7FSS3_9ALTE